MKKINKTKLIMIIIIALVVIAAIILGVIFLGKGGENDVDSKPGTISASESDFETLKVKDIELDYSEERNETIIDFSIENTTEEKLEKLKIDIQLLDENDGLIAGVETNIETIDAKGQHKVNMMLAGNIQGIKKIKLVKPE